MPEPLSREEREAWIAHVAQVPLHPGKGSWEDGIERYEATVQAVEERVKWLRAAMHDALMHCPECTFPDVTPGCHPCQILTDAFVADDAARGEG